MNLQTGQPLWTFTVNNLLLYSPTITEQTVCINCGDDYLYALNPETGERLWRFKIEYARFWSNPIISEKTVYIGTQEFLQALDLETGEQLWRFETPLSDRWVLDPQMWFYGSVNQLMKIFTGNTYNLEKFSEPVVADGVIYVSCSNGYVYALH